MEECISKAKYGNHSLKSPAVRSLYRASFAAAEVCKQANALGHPRTWLPKDTALIEQLICFRQNWQSMAGREKDSGASFPESAYISISIRFFILNIFSNGSFSTIGSCSGMANQRSFRAHFHSAIIPLCIVALQRTQTHSGGIEPLINITACFSAFLLWTYCESYLQPSKRGLGSCCLSQQLSI